MWTPDLKPCCRVLYFLAGSFSLLLGIVGIFLPVMPTVPFLILASFCFARSSQRFHNWLINHRYFGPPIRDWQTHKAIALKTKIVVILMIWGSGTVSMLFLIKTAFLRAITFFLCLVITLILSVGVRTKQTH